MDEMRARVRADIDQHGWHVVKVMGDENAPAWAYSIGLHEKAAHPELCVFGLELEPAHKLLNHVGALVRMGRRFDADGEHEGIFEGLVCGVRGVAPRWLDVFFGNATWHYESPEVPMVQLFWPDPGGRFPWDPAFAADLRGVQPLLYEDEVEKAMDPRLAETLRQEGAL